MFTESNGLSILSLNWKIFNYFANSLLVPFFISRTQNVCFKFNLFFYINKRTFSKKWWCRFIKFIQKNLFLSILLNNNRFQNIFVFNANFLFLGEQVFFNFRAFLPSFISFCNKELLSKYFFSLRQFQSKKFSLGLRFFHLV